MRFNKFAALLLIAATVSVAPLVGATPIAGQSTNVVSLIPGTTASKLGKAEDAAHASGDVGVMMLGVQSTTLGGLGGTTGDYVPPQMNAAGALYVQSVPNTTGGASVYSNIDIDETTGTTTQQMKASAGTLYSCAVTNDTASTKEYVKFYNAVSLTGSAAGTETPVITLPIAGATTLFLNFPTGYSFDTGMTVAATTGIAVADTGAPATNAVVINCTYK